MARTKDSSLSDAEICRAYGWDAGTKLTSDVGQGATVIQVTAVGENRILAKVVAHAGRAVDATEIPYDLRQRDWDKFDPKPQRRQTDIKKR